MENKEPSWDLFISYASEDKEEFVIPLAEALQGAGVKVWIDEQNIKLGDSLVEKINHGLTHSRFGLVVLSPDFFKKKWTNVEYEALFQKEILKEKVILPVWHNVEHKDVARFNLSLASKRAVSSKQGMDYVVKAIIDALGFPANMKASNKNKISSQPQFKKEVAKLFELFGYDEVIHDAKLEGDQCDVVAKSRKRSKANIIAECKFYPSSFTKVGVTEVQNFIFKVSNYRNSGKIDQGYFVTNTGFTADARNVINENVSNYVFLLTYDELLQSLLDIDHYLSDFIDEYDNKGEGSRYVELKLINTTTLDRTILDSLPGDLVNNENTNQSYLVIPKYALPESPEQQTFLDFDKDAFSPLVQPIGFFQQLIDIEHKKKKARTEHNDLHVDCLSKAIQEVAADHGDNLLEALFSGLSKETLNRTHWSPEIVINTLLDKWQEYNGDLHLKTYNKSGFRRRIHRSILNSYKVKARTVAISPKTMEAVPLFSTFSGHIIAALKLEPGNMESLFEKEKESWTGIDEFENIIKYLETEQIEVPELRLLVEEEALPALENYINSDSTSPLILIGDYGAGKTTIMRRLMRKLSAQKLSKKDDPSCRIPLFISLKDYNRVPDIQSLIRLFLQNTVEVDNVSIRTFKKLNEDGRFVFLLDAFDEMLTRVTRADRRRCFKEIAELVSNNSKIILTGRPAYFNDYKEFKENLEALRPKFRNDTKKSELGYEIRCLQLLDEAQVEELIEKSSPHDFQSVLEVLVNKPNLMDLARRPVLAAMIADTGEELINLENQEITARSIYEIYTNRWVQREEDKGEFRLLVHPEQKSTFLRYLAMQMHLSGALTIHYSDLDKSVAQHFNLDTIAEVDHFSHDIRTCSFLSRTDDGYYFFIHKSFMEYFVACEFERVENSPFADNFTNPLTSEMIDLLDFKVLPDRITVLWLNRENLENCKDAIRVEKNASVKNQQYERAALFRDVEAECSRLLEQYNSIFSMKETTGNSIVKEFEIRIKRVYSEYGQSLTSQVTPTIKSFLGDFNLSLEEEE